MKRKLLLLLTIGVSISPVVFSAQVPGQDTPGEKTTTGIHENQRSPLLAGIHCGGNKNLESAVLGPSYSPDQTSPVQSASLSQNATPAPAAGSSVTAPAPLPPAASRSGASVPKVGG